MATTLDITREGLEKLYARIATEYCSSLPLEHFMESTDQAKQREITLESLALVRAICPSSKCSASCSFSTRSPKPT